MLNKRILLLSFILCLSGISVNAESLSDVQYPKAPAYRVGISSTPENQYVQAKQVKPKLEKTYAKIDDSIDSGVADLTYADLSIKRLSKEVAQDLEMDEQDMISDLSLLWQGAAMQSDTINFALYKLANPDADKPDPKSIKNVLKTIASMSTLVGASMGSPIFAGSSLIGGNILSIMSQDTKALNYKYTKVTDADMIILIRKIEDLQQNAVNLYYDYMSAKKQLEMTTKLVEDRQKKFELAQQNNAPRELVVITDAYYRTAIDKQRTAKSEFFSKRAALEQFVGNETFVQFESDLDARERGEKPVSNVDNNPPSPKEENTPTYADTIQNVENYTNSLNSNPSTPKEEITKPQTITSPSVYITDDNDPNLDKVPELKPLDIAPVVEEKPTAEEISETPKENKTKKNSLKSKFSKTKEKKEEKNISPVKEKSKKKSAKIKPENELALEEKSEPKQVKQKPPKKDKYSTKGFIFIHNNQKTTNTTQPSGNDEIEPVVPQQNTKKTQTDSSIKELPPLDEIKVPDLSGHGYSIYSDGDY